MKHLIESKNYSELYNCYAVWIQQNRQYFRTGSNAVRMPDHKIEQPYGFRSYLKTFITDEREVIKAEQDCSDFLSKNPDEVEKNADIFASTFPGIIKSKKLKKEKRDNKTNAKLNEFFEQQSMDLEPKIVNKDLQLSDTAAQMIALAEKGAKHIKTPDGWEVQF